MASIETTRRSMLGSVVAAPLALIPMPAIASSEPSALMAAIRSLNAEAKALLLAEQDDGVWERFIDNAWAIYARVEALPNTTANLKVRALAIASSVGEAEDMASLDLEELAAHAHGLTGRLIRQVLSCVMAGGLN